METLQLKEVMDAERQALAVGPASVAALKQTAEKWQLEHKLKLLDFEGGVAEALHRITQSPK